MSGVRVAALLAASVLLMCTGAASRGNSAPAPSDKPAGSVERQLDDVESTLDSIESELNDG